MATNSYYRDVQPAQRQLSFFNPMQLTQLVRTVRDQKRQGYLDEKLVKNLQGVFWGTYSFGPGCTGNVLVTLHLEDKDGETCSFQAQGLPQFVMHALAGQIFEYFQLCPRSSQPIAHSQDRRSPRTADPFLLRALAFPRVIPRQVFGKQALPAPNDATFLICSKNIKPLG